MPITTTTRRKTKISFFFKSLWLCRELSELKTTGVLQHKDFPEMPAEGRGQVYFCLSEEGVQQIFPPVPPTRCLQDVNTSLRQDAKALKGPPKQHPPFFIMSVFTRPHQQPPWGGGGPNRDGEHKAHALLYHYCGETMFLSDVL